MDNINCYVTFHAEDSDLKKLKQCVATTIKFIDVPRTDSQQLDAARQLQHCNSYLVWDQPESILLVNPSNAHLSTRYQLDNENDKEALTIRLSTSDITRPNPRRQDPGEAKTTNYALYLDLPSLELHESHLRMLRQVVVDSIQDQRSLTVLLNTATVTASQPQDTLWSIHTEKEWKAWQTLLGLLYMTQVQVAYSQDSPLFDMTVLVLPLLDEDYMVSAQLDFGTLFAVDRDTSILNSWNARRQSNCLSPLPIRTIDSSPGDDNKNDDDNNNEDAIKEDHQLQRFDKVVVGGTFDHLHAGHKILLTMTALSSTRATIVGVTDDVMLQSKKYHEWLEPTEQRIEHVRQFCKKIRPDMVYDVVPIYDPYGPTITDPTIDALVCSQETLKGGHMVNDERQKRDFSILTLRVIDVISATSDSTLGNEANVADKISSTWIRNYLAEKKKSSSIV